MVTRSVGQVFRHEDRWRAELPGAVACLSGLGLLAGLQPRVRRRFPWLPWASLAVGAVSGGAFWFAHQTLGWDVAVDHWGVRLVSKLGERLDLGIPVSVRQGRDPTSVVPRYWVAVETDPGRTCLFESPSGMFGSGYSGWPEGSPPEAAERFASATFDLAALRAALWTAMLR